MSEGTFEMFESFSIDNGELAGMTPQQCFVLGYELAQIHSIAKDYRGVVDKTVHADNLERIKSALEKRSRRYEVTWPHDDVSESWVFLRIFEK